MIIKHGVEEKSNYPKNDTSQVVNTEPDIPHHEFYPRNASLRWSDVPLQMTSAS